MTALTYTTDVFTSNSNDADFRQWGSTISAHLLAAGLVQTSDSAQINWATVLKSPSGNGVAGYEMWRFNDALQATAPIFIKIEYGNSDSTSIPGIYITVGTGTNGAGTLTGTISNRRQVNSGSSPTAGSWVSKVCYAGGFFGCTMYRGLQGASQVPLMAFMVQRTMDDSGAWTGDGCVVVWSASSSTAGMQALNFVNGTKNTFNQIHTLFPGGTTSTLTDDVVPNYQAVRSYQLFPKMRALGGSCVVYLPEVGIDTQFSLALIGTTPRNFICTGVHFGNTQAAGQSSNFGMAMLWE